MIAAAPLCLIGVSSFVQFGTGIRIPTNILHAAESIAFLFIRFLRALPSAGIHDIV